MFHDLSPEMAGLVSNWCNTLLYGMTVVTYFLCMYLLIKRISERSRTVTWILAGTSTIQFILATVNVTVALLALLDGFIYTENIPTRAHLYWINPAAKSLIISKAVYITNSVVGDFVLIWRLYMVWGKNIYVCILPFILTCCTAITGSIADSKIAAISDDVAPGNIPDLVPWVSSYRYLSIAAQFVLISLIAGMIWRHTRQNPLAKSRYTPLITRAGTIPVQMMTQISTIVPCLIIIRVEIWVMPSDVTSRRQYINTQPVISLSGDREQDLSVQVTVVTLKASDSV
ncbi:hypothetical protein D9619_011085 [Psilocybe cf. subviscida]|uniref:Uncharacterized protein n=1 Tax=Psilocybe cf. subviscida TaxID=2480587 RepID=A0A8H5BJ34_9AGAR|nr:hypothetical protein D9619_011085 [Psilocybe cf. subviscida]